MQYQAERETNEKLVEYVSVYERTIQHMESENEALRRQLLEMEKTAQTSTSEPRNNPAVVDEEKPLPNVLAEILRACEQTALQQEKLTQSMR
jgi:hypothetical protein